MLTKRHVGDEIVDEPNNVSENDPQASADDAAHGPLQRRSFTLLGNGVDIVRQVGCDELEREADRMLGAIDDDTLSPLHVFTAIGAASNWSGIPKPFTSDTACGRSCPSKALTSVRIALALVASM